MASQPPNQPKGFSDSSEEPPTPDPERSATGQTETEAGGPPAIDAQIVQNAINLSLVSMRETHRNSEHSANVQNAAEDSWERSHAQALHEINAKLATFTAEKVTEGHSENNPHSQTDEPATTCFTVASPSPAEVAWIIDYAKKGNVAVVTQEFVTQLLTALRSTNKVDSALLPQPEDTVTFREGLPQVVLQTDHSTTTPEAVNHTLRLQSSRHRPRAQSTAGQVETEPEKFDKLRTFMADLNMDANKVMNILLQEMASPSEKGSTHREEAQTVVRNTNFQAEGNPVQRNVVFSPPRQTAQVRKRLTYPGNLEQDEGQNQRSPVSQSPQLRRSPQTSQREKSNERILKMHEIEALELQINYTQETKGLEAPELIKRRDQLVCELYPQYDSTQNLRRVIRHQDDDQRPPSEINEVDLEPQERGRGSQINHVGAEQVPTQGVPPLVQGAQINQPSGHWPGNQGIPTQRFWLNQGNPWGNIQNTALPMFSGASAQMSGIAASLKNFSQPPGQFVGPSGQNTVRFSQPPSSLGHTLPGGGGGGNGPPSHDLERGNNALEVAGENRTGAYYLTPANEMIIISKMKLPTYRGRTDRKTPYEYVRQIRVAAETNGVSLLSMLQRKIPTLLIDEAANWFAVNVQNFTSWEIFHKLFMEEYSCPNYYQKLASDLEKRRQDPGEAGTVFLHKITLLCREIEPTTPDWYIIQKAIANMHPDYRQRLYPHQSLYPSLYHFEQHLKQIQTDLFETRTYKPPPPPHEFAEPAFAYEDNKTQYSVAFEQKPTYQQQSSSTAIAPAQPNNRGLASVSLSSLNPQITRQRARDTRPRSNSADRRNDSSYRTEYSQRSANEDRSRSPFRPTGASNYGTNSYNRGYSPNRTSWTSPGGTGWARRDSPYNRSQSEDREQNKFSRYQSPSRSNEGHSRSYSPSRALTQGEKGERKESPGRQQSPSRYQANAGRTEGRKN